MRYKVLAVLSFLFIGLNCFAQDKYLWEIAVNVLKLRENTVSTRNSVIKDLSATGNPKITLMDEISLCDGEYRGRGANRFMMNHVVYCVSKRQGGVRMESRGDFFNSNERGVYYSIIEKTINKGKKVTYTISGHAGIQEFIVVPYNANSKFTVVINGRKAEPLEGGAQYVNIGKVMPTDKISITICYSNDNSANFESFVILNHNPQK